DWEIRRRGFIANWRKCQIHFVPLDFPGVIDGSFHKAELDAMTIKVNFEVINPGNISVKLLLVDTATNLTGYPYLRRAIVDASVALPHVSIFSSVHGSPDSLIGRVYEWGYEEDGVSTRLYALGSVISIPPGIQTLNGEAHTIAEGLIVGAITATSIGFQPEADRQFDCQSVTRIRLA